MAGGCGGMGGAGMAGDKKPGGCCSGAGMQGCCGGAGMKCGAPSDKSGTTDKK
jgi:hypothetical protein